MMTSGDIAQSADLRCSVIRWSIDDLVPCFAAACDDVVGYEGAARKSVDPDRMPEIFDWS